MIVRISNEGQYEIDDSHRASLNELDNAAVAACDTFDETQFRDAFGRLLGYIREHGHQLPDDELVGSDLILPPPDVSLDEARAEFQGEGLIPN